MEHTYFEYREPESYEELQALLRLRYNVYQESRFQDFASKFDDAGIELDSYDVRAHHYGLFELSNGSSRPVGYIRMVGNTARRWSNEILSLAKKNASLAEQVCTIQHHPLPLMKYFPDAEVVREYHRNACMKGKSIEEAGRLSLDKSVRSMTVSWHMVAFSFAMQMVRGVDETIVTCIPRHTAFYTQFGFERLAGTSDHYCPETKATFSCLRTSNRRPPETIQEQLEKMIEAYHATGRICFNPAQHGNYRELQEEKQTGLAKAA
jgi:hypothetical protein